MQLATDTRTHVSTQHTRYTLCGEAAAEARVAQDLSRLTTGIDSELGEELRALLLTGPFARAEGGIACRDGEPHADDPGYELLVVFRNHTDRHDRKLDEMAAAWARMLDARVALAAFSTHELADVAATRFWFHAGRGWLITLLGDPAVCLAIPRREPSDLRFQETPLTLCEAFTELALCALDASAGEAAAVACMHRAALASGDALLLRRKQYADTLSARAAALDVIHASAALRAAYRDAIAFCARPDAWQPESRDLPSWLASTRRALADALVHAEAERLGSARDLLGFLTHPEPLCVEAPARKDSAVRRAIRSVPLLPRAHRWRANPVERLLRSSAALALATHAPDCRNCAAELLGISQREPSDLALAGALRELAVTTLTATRSEHPFSRFPQALRAKRQA